MFDTLFGPDPIGEAFDLQRRKALDDIARRPAEGLRNADLETLVADCVAPYRMEPLVLHWGDKAALANEGTFEVDHKVSGPTGLVDDIDRITFVVPFSGMSGLFHLLPTRHTGSTPRGFTWERQKLLAYSVARAELAVLQRDLQKQEEAIKRWVAWVNRDVDSFNADLQRSVRAELAARLDRIRAGDDLLAGLGVRQAALELLPAPRDAPRHPGPASREGPTGSDRTEFRDVNGQSASLPVAHGQEAGRGGRPKGTRYLILAEVLRAKCELDVDAAAGKLKTQKLRIRRYVTMQDLADKLDAPLATLQDFLRAESLSWADRASWPPE